MNYSVLNYPLNEKSSIKDFSYHGESLQQALVGYSSNEHESHHGCSKSIPISKSIRRTPSEIQLHEDEVAAEYRDYCMYVRLVNGLNEKQSGGSMYRGGASTEQSLANIIRTRHSPLSESPSNDYQEDYSFEFVDRQSTIPSVDGYDFYVVSDQEDESEAEDEGIFELDL